MDSVLHAHKPNQPFTLSREYWPERQYPDSGSGYVEPEGAPRLTEALLDRGYGESEIRHPGREFPARSAAGVEVTDQA